MSDIKTENIKLSLPVNSAYVSAARLTASSIANRLGFYIDEIEDIKASVSESCNFLIKKLPHNTDENFLIEFNLTNNVINITFSNKTLKVENYEDDMSLLMIKALMDNVEFLNDSEYSFILKMTKTHTVNNF